MTAMAAAARLKTVELSLLEKLRLLNWPFVAVVILIGAGRLRHAVLGRRRLARALGLAAQRALRDRPGADAGDRADRHPGLVPLGLCDLRRGAAGPDRGRDRRQHQHGRAALDQPRPVPAAALRGHEDRAGAGARALLPRHLPRGRGAPGPADRAARDRAGADRAGPQAAGSRDLGHAARGRRRAPVPRRRPLVEVRAGDRRHARRAADPLAPAARLPEAAGA